MKINSISNIFFAQNKKTNNNKQTPVLKPTQDTLCFSEKANAMSLNLINLTQKYRLCLFRARSFCKLWWSIGFVFH